MSLSKPIDTLNEQMNLLVESQAQEIKELKEEKEKLIANHTKEIQDAYECHYSKWKAGQENTTITELEESNGLLEETCGDLREEIEDLKKDYDKNSSAAEVLTYMDYKYRDGYWSPAECEF